MTSAANPRATGGRSPSAPPSDPLTHVELIRIEKRIEFNLRFGRPVANIAITPERRRASFQPGDVFAFLRWATSDFGTIISRIDIVRAVRPGESYQTLPFVRPGGEILLRVEGQPKVEQVLRHIDAVETARIDPQDVAPDHWRHVGNRIGTGHEPRPYTAERHRAWLKRREIEQ